MPGCPIRKSTDQIVCADPRSLSQLITSFVASESLGIHRLPFSVFAPNVYQYCYQKIRRLYTNLFYMLYVVFSFVFIKYVNDRFLLNLVDRSTLGLIHRPRGPSCSATLARVTRSLQEVVPSFAVAKVYQIPNTNQIFPRKTSENMLQSCTHFPLNKTLTTMEKILRRKCNIPPLPLGITLKSVPKSSVSLRLHPRPTPKAPQDPA